MILLALAATASFDPIRFFAGRTEGIGRLRIMLHAPRAVRVHGTGTPADGGLSLRQSVEQDGKPAIVRRWALRRLAPGRYTGTLTGSHGPVAAWASGDTLHIAYRGPSGTRIEQRLVLAPDGRSAQNRLTVRRVWIVVARPDETITKLD